MSVFIHQVIKAGWEDKSDDDDDDDDDNSASSSKQFISY